MLLSEYASKKFQNGKHLPIARLVITKAYFHGRPKRDLCVFLPGELGLPSSTIGSLQRCMYGTRDTGSICEDTYASAIKRIGFKRGRASPCCFFDPVSQIRLVVHGDDFTAVGTRKALDKYEKQLQAIFDLIIRGRLSHELGTQKEIRLLNQIITINKDGVYYVADPRHAELMIQTLGLHGANSLSTP